MTTPPFPTQEDSIAAGNLLVSEFEPSPISHSIVLHDETLRDGEQTVGVSFSPEVKIEMARRLIGAGVRYLNLGFPAVSETEQEVARTIAAEARQLEGLSCLARAKKEDIRVVADCGIPLVGLFIATSDIHLRHKLRISEEDAYRQIVDQVQFARSAGLRVRFAFEDATRTPLDRIKRFATGALEAGASQVGLCDTCGVLTPLTAHRFVAAMAEEIGGETIALHFHNDLGMATANTLVALAAGARMAQTSVSGIGERAGNACMEELVVALRVKYGIDLGIDLTQIRSLAERVRELVGFPTVPNEPIVGDYAFAHESGIHVAGLMRDAANYEPFPPSLVGAEHSVWFGKHAGLSNIRFVAQRHGLEVSDDTAQDILQQTKRRAIAGERIGESAVLEMLKAAS